MKKLSILLAIMAFPVLVNADTYFKDGMKWISLATDSHLPGGAHSIETVTLQKSATSDWLEMNSHSVGIEEEYTSDRFIGYVKSEGDKVFFKLTDEENAESYLFYDFGLKEGEGCYVYSPVYSKQYKTYMKCVGIGEDPEFPGFETMSLIEYKDDSCTGDCRELKWIKGLSSENGVLLNNGLDIVGIGGTLWEASYEGKILYANPQAEIKDISSEPDLDIHIDGLILTVSAQSPTEVGVYSLSGVNLGNYKFGKNPISIILPTKGLYILKAGEKAIKIEI